MKEELLKKLLDWATFLEEVIGGSINDTLKIF